MYYLINEKQLDFCNSLENIWCWERLIFKMNKYIEYPLNWNKFYHSNSSNFLGSSSWDWLDIILNVLDNFKNFLT